MNNSRFRLVGILEQVANCANHQTRSLHTQDKRVLESDHIMHEGSELMVVTVAGDHLFPHYHILISILNYSDGISHFGITHLCLF